MSVEYNKPLIKTLTNLNPQTTCLAIGDPHFQVSNVLDAKELINKCEMLVNQLKPTFVVILGDILHTHEKIHVTPFNLATDLITRMSKLTHTFVLIGNHDYCNNSQFLTSRHPFNSFKDIANVTVCDRVVSCMIGNEKYIFTPYVPPERLEEALDTLSDVGQTWTDARCIFAHQEFFGCRFNPVMTSTDGDIWPEDFPLVISGHIHDAQRLQSNIYYTGSSMQHAFGESHDKTIAYVTFRGSEFSIKKIDLELRKKKIKYMNVEDADQFKLETNTLVKLVLKGRPEQFKVFRRGQIYKQLQEQGIAISFSPHSVEPDTQERKKPEKRAVLDILKGMIEKEDEYVHKAYSELV